MRISELAKATNESPRTIRYYESLGLISDPPRTSNGYRDYDTEAIDQIRFIRGLQAAELSLAEIKAVSDIAAMVRPLDASDAALITSARARVERHLETLNSVRVHLAALTQPTTAPSPSRMLPRKSIPHDQPLHGRPTR
jgi:DNA-binding transcriptional MerR regulator